MTYTLNPFERGDYYLSLVAPRLMGGHGYELMLYALLALMVLDVLSTCYALGAYPKLISEANPVVRAILQKVGVVPWGLFKSLPAFSMAIWPTYACLVLAFLLAHLALVAWNVRVILRARARG